MQIITRQEAKEKGLSRYYTGKACVNGHVSTRNTKNGTCHECCRTSKTRKAYCANYYKANKDRLDSKMRMWNNENRERRREITRKWDKANRKHKSQWNKDYRKNNSARFSAYCRDRQSSKLNATPVWVNHSELIYIYEKRNQLNKVDGNDYQVDHYYPLQGKTICGLHVPWNLQIITAEENRAKGNKMPEEFYGANHTMSQLPA